MFFNVMLWGVRGFYFYLFLLNVMWGGLNFFVLSISPVSSRRRKILFLGEMLEELVGEPTSRITSYLEIRLVT